MDDFASVAVLLMLGCAVAAVIASLYAHAKVVERERLVIDLRHRVTSLRTQYAERLAEIAARERGVEVAELADEQDHRRAA